MLRYRAFAMALVATTLIGVASASDSYLLQPGDMVSVTVWKEAEASGDFLIRPDGGISVPLAGDVEAANHTPDAVRAIIDQRLRKYIADPAVTVSVKQTLGNQIFVLGKVNRPGQFAVSRPVDVMQALSLAGGTTPFASLNHIHILRREGEHEVWIAFHYGAVERGHDLQQNIVLKSGDTVIVP
jgi:polysaccharide biosynthesis/export protein